MKMNHRRISVRSLAAIAFLSGYWGLSVTTPPQAEEVRRQARIPVVYWTAAYIQKIVTPRAAAQSLTEGRGKVIAVTPENQQVVLEHGEIKGFMDAMTMGYKVSSTSLLKGLKPGDEVTFSIDPEKSTIVKIRKLDK